MLLEVKIMIILVVGVRIYPYHRWSLDALEMQLEGKLQEDVEGNSLNSICAIKDCLLSCPSNFWILQNLQDSPSQAHSSHCADNPPALLTISLIYPSHNIIVCLQNFEQGVASSQ